MGSLNLCGRIDCAGILKLRNSDIELRKGETDIGRKNTRVRMVFRVHIEQASGRTVSLQAASNPIECCECAVPNSRTFILIISLFLCLADFFTQRMSFPHWGDKIPCLLKILLATTC